LDEHPHEWLKIDTPVLIARIAKLIEDGDLLFRNSAQKSGFRTAVAQLTGLPGTAWRVTPAMEAGITDRAWSLLDIIAA
jgi:hypothetical protein